MQPVHRRVEPGAAVTSTGSNAEREVANARVLFTAVERRSTTGNSGDERSRSLHQALLHGVPATHAQSYRFAGLRGPHKRLHAVSPHENSSAADVEEYTKVRDVMDHASIGTKSSTSTLGREL